MKSKIKVFITDDHKLLLDTVSSSLNSYESIEVIGQAQNGKETLEFLNKKEPDILILDIDMPVMDGEETAKEVRKKFPNVKIIMLSMYWEPSFIREFYRIGVSSYLSKGCSIDEIVMVIDEVYKNGQYYNDKTKKILEEINPVEPKNNILGREALDEIEIQILKLICDGKRGKEIADILNIPVGTVDYHKKNIKRKTKLDSIPELVKYAIKQGIISLK